MEPIELASLVAEVDAVFADRNPRLVTWPPPQWPFDGDPEDEFVSLGGSPPDLCDACDSGSDDLLEVLDEQFVAVVSGTFRRLTKGDRTITQMNASGYSARGQFRSRVPSPAQRLRRLPDIEEVLASPKGWEEVTGAAWI